MGDLSPNFARREFACRCCGKAVVDPRLVAALQELRDLAGAPICINSGYRCEAHNRAIGGAVRSRHRLGQAADIVIEGHTVAEMYRLAGQVPAFAAGGIGIYPDQGFLHVDVREWQARWGRIDVA